VYARLCELITAISEISLHFLQYPLMVVNGDWDHFKERFQAVKSRKPGLKHYLTRHVSFLLFFSEKYMGSWCINIMGASIQFLGLLCIADTNTDYQNIETISIILSAWISNQYQYRLCQKYRLTVKNTYYLKIILHWMWIIISIGYIWDTRDFWDVISETL
jgi:hypothetical protein